MYSGIASGGPFDGERLQSECALINLPIQKGPDRGPGNRGFDAAYYRWDGDKWAYTLHRTIWGTRTDP